MGCRNSTLLPAPFSAASLSAANAARMSSNPARRRTPMTSHDDQRGSARRTVALQRTEVGTDEEHRPRRGDTYRRRWWTLAILSVSLLIIIIDDTIINVAVPTLQRELGASASAL